MSDSDRAGCVIFLSIAVVIQGLVGRRLPFPVSPADDRCRQSSFFFKLVSGNSCADPRPVRAARIHVELRTQQTSSWSTPKIQRARLRQTTCRANRAGCFKQDAGSGCQDAKRCWPRCAQPAKRRMTFQRVPDCTQLEIGKEREGDKVVVCRPIRSLGRDPHTRPESHLFY